MVPPAPYIPAPHLAASSRLTAQELVSLFEDFSNTLRYVSSAPELVFERLVANLSDTLNATFEAGWQVNSNFEASRLMIETLAIELREKSSMLQASQRANEALTTELGEMSLALKSSQVHNKALQASQLANKKLKAELAKLETRIPPPAVVRTNPVIGDFHTKEVRFRGEFPHENCKTISFASAYTMVPGLVVGLTAVNASCNANVRTKAYTSQIQRDCITIHIDSWMDTRLYEASCTWLQIEADDMDFQYGSYHTLEDQESDMYPAQYTRMINFKRTYSATPKVVVWLSAIDIGQGSSWRIRSYATDVTATGFTIHIDSGGDSRLFSAMASWVAYPTKRPGIASGNVSIHDIRSWAQPRAYNSAFEAFDAGVFERPPRVFIALNALNIDRKHNMRLRLKVDNVSAAGMTWHLNSWDNSILYSAGASYIAFS